MIQDLLTYGSILTAIGIVIFKSIKSSLKRNTKTELPCKSYGCSGCSLKENCNP